MNKKLTSIVSAVGLVFFLLFTFNGTPASADTYVFTRDLTVGSTGADVVELQTAMVGLGKLVMPVGVPMGYFGNLTQAAVANWQASVGISPAAGYFGPISRGYVSAHGFGLGITSKVPGCLPGYSFSPLTGAPCTAQVVNGCAIDPVTGAIIPQYDPNTGARICPPPTPPSNDNTFTLTLSKSGSGSGTITSSSGGLDCGPTCSTTFNSGKSVTLTATASTGSTFVGWSGDCSGTSNTCTVNLDSNTSVSAIFNKSLGVVGGGSDEIQTNVSYGSDSKQVVDVYYNTGYQNAPIALLVHGGSWTGGDKSDMTTIATKAFYPAGYVTITVDYRLMNTNTLENDWSAGLNDVACAVSWAKANASKYGGDPNNVVLYGQSAGSQLTGMIAYDPEGGWLSGCQTQGQSLNVAGFMGSGGVYDFTKVRADERWQPGCLLEQYLGLNSCGPRDSSWGNADPSKLLSVSPVHYVNSGDPRTLIINGQADCYVNYPDPGTGLCQANSVALDAALTSAGVEHTLYSIPGYAHGDFKQNFGANPSNFPIALSFIDSFK